MFEQNFLYFFFEKKRKKTFPVLLFMQILSFETANEKVFKENLYAHYYFKKGVEQDTGNLKRSFRFRTFIPCF